MNSMVRLILENEIPGQWVEHEGVFVKGFAFDGDALLNGESLASYFRQSVNDLAATLVSTYGEFAAIINDEEGPILITDRIRSTPIFYGKGRTGPVCGNDVASIGPHVDISTPPPVAIASFLLQGMTVGAETLVPEIKSVGPGEIVRWTGSDFRIESYFVFGPSPDIASSGSGLVDEGVACLEDAFRRMLNSTPGPFVVPLSGGLDSRLVASMLARAGRDDTVCFSYGSRAGFEARTSREVAARLGLRWEFVDYTGKTWNRWAGSPEYRSYRRISSQFTTIEHEQDWPAIRELVSRSRLTAECVLVPGHSGDFLAGSHLPNEAFSDGNVDAIRWIRNKYFRLWPDSRLPDSVSDAIDERIAAVIDGAGEGLADDPVASFDYYGWRERQAKMIVNSVRAYEFFGCEWRLPLWDGAVIEFWNRVGLHDRRDKSLYVQVVSRLIGDLMDVPWRPAERPGPSRLVDRLTDRGFHRYGMFGPSSPLERAVYRIADAVTLDDAVLRAIVAPYRRYPLSRATVNGLLALHQLQDSLIFMQQIESRE